MCHDEGMTDKQGIALFRAGAPDLFDSGIMSDPEFDADEHGDDWAERRARVAR